MESRLDRIVQLSKSMLDELQSQKRLSDILPQIRLLAEMTGDNVHVAWVDCEIYGVEHVPKTTPRNIAGMEIFADLHKIPDISTIDISDLIRNAFNGDRLPKHDRIAPQSVRQLEEREFLEVPGPPRDADLSRIHYQSRIFDLEAARIVQNVRSYAHQYVGGVWQYYVTEKENQSLLGPDYRIVVDNLDGLQTGVGQELMAAFANLRSENPANWKLAALGCRNVIIKLGDSLWKVPCTKYFSELDNKELDLVGEKEKNRLYAYIDYHHKRVEGQDKDTLKQLHGKVWGIYDMGSKGKRAIRHEEAKTAIVDTFELVGNLDAITELKPLEEI